MTTAEGTHAYICSEMLKSSS